MSIFGCNFVYPPKFGERTKMLRKSLKESQETFENVRDAFDKVKSHGPTIFCAQRGGSNITKHLQTIDSQLLKRSTMKLTKISQRQP